MEIAVDVVADAVAVAAAAVAFVAVDGGGAPVAPLTKNASRMGWECRQS